MNREITYQLVNHKDNTEDERFYNIDKLCNNVKIKRMYTKISYWEAQELLKNPVRMEHLHKQSRDRAKVTILMVVVVMLFFVWLIYNHFTNGGNN